MANVILTKRKSTTGDPVPGDLEQGELAINTLDEKLFSKNTSNAIFEIGGGGIGGSIANDQIAVGAATADDIEGSVTLTYDGTGIHTSLGLEVTGGDVDVPNVHLVDNGTIYLGTGDDSTILFNGTDTYFKAPVGGDFRFTMENGSETGLVISANAGVDLYHNNVVKAATTAGGLDVTGTIDSSNLITVTSAIPRLRMYETGVTADNGYWDFRAQAEVFALRTRTDADGAGASVFTVNRTGTTVDSVVFGAPITATSYGGITEANLVDKTAVETISANWTWDTNAGGSLKMSDGTDTIIWSAVSGTVTVQPTGGMTTVDFNLAVTANSFGGITEANLVDKSATEAIAGTWTLDGAVTTSDYGTGGRVKDGTDVSRPVGFNVMPVYEIDAADTFDLAHNGMIWHKDAGGALSFTFANDATIPQGATWVVHNDDTEDLTLAQSGTTIYWLEAGAAPSSGNVTIEQGGIVTLYKYSDAVAWAWGSKAAGGSVPTQITVQDESADTTCFPMFAISATGDIAPKTGTNLTFNSSTGNLSATQIAGITAANLLDKSTTETVSGQWVFSAAAITLPANVFLKEDTAAATDSATYGQFWVKNNVPNDAYFTGDTGIDYPLAYATYRRSSASVLDNLNQTLNMTTDSVADAMVNGCWGKTTTTARTLTLEPSTDTQFPVGAQIAIWNRGASGNMTVTEGTGTTLYVLTGSATTDAAGSATIAPGGYATLIRESTTVYLLMGAGITP